MTESSKPRASPFRRRLPLLLALGIGFIVWQNGFGFLATERTVEWRLPVPYAELRTVDLQIWKGETLLKRDERTFTTGAMSALTSTVPLARGDHRAVASVTLISGEIRSFQFHFDPAALDAVVLEPSRRF